MTDANKLKQARIYHETFRAERLHYDTFLLAPNDYIREKYFARLEPAPGARVLEIGIGINSFLGRAVRRHRIRAFGLDYVETSLAAQKRSAPCRLRLCRGDAERLPYRDGSFDHVVAVSVIEHLSDYPRAFRELFRVLGPGGTAIVQVPCRDFRFSLFAKLKTADRLRHEEWFVRNQESSGHDFCRIPDRRGWQRLAAQAGFAVVRCEAADIVLDSWMMYSVYQFLKDSQSYVIRLKRSPGRRPGRDGGESGGETADSSHHPGSSPEPAVAVRYSLKRRVLGFVWYQAVLRIFWMLLLPERLLRRFPVGASVYLTLRRDGPA